MERRGATQQRAASNAVCLTRRRRGVFLLVPLIALVQYKNGTWIQHFMTSMRHTAIVTTVDTSTTPTRGASRDTATQLDTNAVSDAMAHFAPSSTTGSRRTQRSLLIAQYAATTASETDGNQSYHQFLAVTSSINQAYCILWHCDYIILRGVMDPSVSWNDTFVMEHTVVDGQRVPVVTTTGLWHQSSHHRQDRPSKRTTSRRAEAVAIPDSRATYNKLAILDWALTEPNYECVLILDADAMMYDFDRDITTLLPHNELISVSNEPSKSGLPPGPLLVAHKTNRSDVPATGSINVGVTLWDLRHPLTPLLLDRWKAMCYRRIWSGKVDDDQAPLQSILKELDATKRERVVHAISREFAYGNGLWIKHFIRPAGSTWESSTTADIDERLRLMQTTVRDICALHAVCVCDLCPWKVRTDDCCTCR